MLLHTALPTAYADAQIGVYHKVAELDFVIGGRVGQISATTFDSAIHHAVALLREFDAALSGRRLGSLQWYIGRLGSNSSLLVQFLSRQKPLRTNRERVPDVSRGVTASFVNGFEDLELRAETPPYLSEFGLRRAEDLTRLIGQDGAEAFTFRSEAKEVKVTQRTTENIRKLLPIKRTATGSVEGTLEAINVHRHPKFIVYHSISNKAISCEFNQERWMSTVKDNLGSRVAVFGKLHKNINGDTLRVTVEEIKGLDGEKRFTLPDVAELGEPEFATAPSTTEYLRRIRGAE